MVFCNLERLMPHLLVYKSKNFGSWVYQLMIQFIVVSSFFLRITFLSSSRWSSSLLSSLLEL